MNKKLIAIFLAALFVTGSTITGRGHPQTSKQSFVVSKYGTLLDMLDANGKSRFGKLADNGFVISYQLKDKTNSVSAVGDEVKGLLPGKMTTDGQSATVIATTSDHALEITTYFVLNEKTKKLIIQRNFRNISGGPLTLKMVREFVDPALVNDGKLANKLTSSRPTDDCRAADCPKDPPPCPTPCVLFTIKQAQLLTETNPVAGRPDLLGVQWQDLGSFKENNQVSTVVLIPIQPEGGVG